MALKVKKDIQVEASALCTNQRQAPQLEQVCCHLFTMLHVISELSSLIVIDLVVVVVVVIFIVL